MNPSPDGSTHSKVGVIGSGGGLGGVTGLQRLSQIAWPSGDQFMPGNVWGVVVRVHVLVGRDDVAPIVGRKDGARVVEMAALQVAVVRDRGRVLDVRVALRTGRVADPHLLFVVQSGGRHDRDRGEKCQPEAEREKRAGSDLLAARAGLRHSLAATLAACAADGNHPIDTARGGVRTS